MTTPRAIVYVVDDDASTRELLAWLMKRNDLEVEAYSDAASFLAAYRPDRPGCLVLDLNMPGMSGLDLQRALKDQGVVLPVIFLSRLRTHPADPELLAALGPVADRPLPARAARWSPARWDAFIDAALDEARARHTPAASVIVPVRRR